MIKVTVDKNKTWCAETERLTFGEVGKAVNFEFSSEWTGLTVYAVFKAYDTQVTVKLTVSDLAASCDIPASVLRHSNVKLSVGLYGYNVVGSRVLASVFADLGMIHASADPTVADNFVPIDMQMYSDVLNAANTAAAAAAAAADAAVAAASGNYASSVTFSVPVDPSSDYYGHLIMTTTVNNSPTVTDLGIATAFAAALAGNAALPEADQVDMSEMTETTFGQMLAKNAADLSETIEGILSDVQDQISDLQSDIESSIDTAVAQATSDVSTALSTAQSAASTANAAKTQANTNKTNITNLTTTVNGKQAKHKTATVTLASGKKSWTDQNCSGVTASNTVICRPAPASYNEWVSNQVRCVKQASGKLNFSANSVTSAAITVNVLILD